jgi:hypothetical protein
MTIDAMIAVLQAAAAKKVIQFRRAGGDAWADHTTAPEWDFSNWEYRVKPEPREWWLAMFPGDVTVCTSLTSAEDVRFSKGGHSRYPEQIIHVREVID